MEIKVKAVEGTEQKSVQEIENKLLEKLGSKVSEIVTRKTTKSNGAITANDQVPVTHATNIILDAGRTILTF